MTHSNDGAQSQDIADELRALRADVARLTKMVSDLSDGKARATGASFAEAARARADAYRDAVSQRAQDARAQAEAMRDKASETVSDSYSRGQDAVRKNPTIAVAAALGFGALLARTVLRRV